MLRRLLYSPFLAQLVVTRRCNLSCAYCNEFDRTSPEIPVQVLRGRADKLRQLGTWGLELTGGEPMLHSGIYDLIAHAKHDLRFRQVMLISNAFLLNAERVEKLNQAGLDDLQVSVDGVEPSDKTVKVLRPLRPKLEMLARVARFRVTLNAVIGSAPAAEAVEVLEFARAHRFRPRACFIHGEDGQLLLKPEDARMFDGMGKRFGGKLLDGGDYRTRLMRDGRAPFRCRAGSRYLYVDEEGIVRWCSQQRPTWGVPLEQYDAAELRRQFQTPKSCNVSCTVGCVRTCSAYDEWRPQRRPEIQVPETAPDVVEIRLPGKGRAAGGAE